MKNELRWAWGFMFVLPLMVSCAGQSFLAEDAMAPANRVAALASGFDPEGITGDALDAPLQDTVRTSSQEGSANEPKAPPGSKRLLIYRGEFALLVPAVEESIDRWLGRIESVGGYLQKRTQGRVVCRVPADKFRMLVGGLGNFGRILSQSLDAQDVTREYLDLELRLSTAQKSLARLQVLLEKAEKVEDLLKIETEMRRLTEEIERFKGNLRFMQDQIAFATLTVGFQGNAPTVRTSPRQKSRFGWIRAVGIERMRGRR